MKAKACLAFPLTQIWLESLKSFTRAIFLLFFETLVCC